MENDKITKEDVYKLLVKTATEFTNPLGGAISLVEMANFLKTSRYQVKKNIDVLKAEGLVELKCFNLSCEDCSYPPYWGYRLTVKGKDTQEYKMTQKKASDLIEECFGCVGTEQI